MLARAAILVIVPLFLTACLRSSEKPPNAPRQNAESLGAQLEACRQAHERLVPGREIETLRAELRRYAEVADKEARRQVGMQRAMDEFTKGVCLIHGKFSLNERQDQKLVPVTNSDGSRLELEYLGSGFLVSESGDILTNRHIAQPWWNNETVAPLLQRGLEPSFSLLTVTFPLQEPIDIDPATIRVSEDGVDLAVFRASVHGVPILPLSDRNPKELRGQKLMLMGYPTGLSALLARAELDVVSAALAEAQDLNTLIGALSKRHAITPVITHGTLNDATANKLIYDAVTTSGGSGGPVFGPDGDVIGVNFAILREFQGSNFGVPIRFARTLLP